MRLGPYMHITSSSLCCPMCFPYVFFLDVFSICLTKSSCVTSLRTPNCSCCKSSPLTPRGAARGNPSRRRAPPLPELPFVTAAAGRRHGGGGRPRHQRFRGVLAVEVHVRDGLAFRPSVGVEQHRGMPGWRPRGEVAGEPVSAVLPVVAGAGSAADLALGEPRRRLLLVWMRGLVEEGRRDGHVGGGCFGDQMRQRQRACPGSIWALGAVEAARPWRLHPCVVSASVARGLATAWPSLCSRLWALGGSRTTVVPGS
jgi:hypothetical protein